MEEYHKNRLMSFAFEKIPHNCLICKLVRNENENEILHFLFVTEGLGSPVDVLAKIVNYCAFSVRFVKCFHHPTLVDFLTATSQRLCNQVTDNMDFLVNRASEAMYSVEDFANNLHLKYLHVRSRKTQVTNLRK